METFIKSGNIKVDEFNNYSTYMQLPLFRCCIARRLSDFWP